MSRVSEPALLIPPPVVAEPPVIFRLLRVAVTPGVHLQHSDRVAAADRGQAPAHVVDRLRRRGIRQTRVPSVGDRVMGWAVLNWTVLGAGSGEVRGVVVDADIGPADAGAEGAGSVVSAAVVTWYEELAS